LKDRWLVCIGAGRWQLSGIGAAKKAGLKVLALDGAADAPGFALADRHVVVNLRDPDAVLQSVRDQNIVPSGAVSFVTDAGMASAARIREEFGLVGPNRQVALRLTNKCVQREVWTRAGLPCPRWFRVTTRQEADAAAREIEGKAILKPADSAGSRGVHVFDAGDAWRDEFENALTLSVSKSCIVEAFVVGTEFTVETFAHRGNSWVLAISEKKKVPGTQDTVASELATPSLAPEPVNQIGRLAVDALLALGHTDGPGHTEILRDANGSLWLVEAAGRGGGFMVADGIVPRASGFDLSKACALQAVGLQPDIPSGIRCAFVLRFLPSNKGTVTHIGGFDRANLISNVECQPLVRVGEQVEDARTDGGRLAFIFSWADDRVSAFDYADRAERCLDVAIAQPNSN
jgi:biotin carboxylase